MLGVLLLLLAGAVAAQSPTTLSSKVGNYTVQATFVDGLPIAGASSRLAVTVIDEQNRQIPDEPAILYLSGGPQSFRIQLDRTPTTIVTLPALDAGSYDLRVQVPGEGATAALEMTIANRRWQGDPIAGAMLVIGGVVLLAFIILSGRFSK